MFIHSVYFRLRDGLSAADRRRFDEGLDLLLSIDTITEAHRGTPADTDRPVIDRAYTVGIVVFFPDRAAHDAYQDHPKHDRFRDDCAQYWEAVRIFDMVTPA